MRTPSACCLWGSKSPFQKPRTGSELGVRHLSCSSSSGIAVLVDESAKDVVAVDALNGEGAGVGVVGGGAKLQCPVRPAAVVVRGILGEHVPGVLLAVEGYPGDFLCLGPQTCRCSALPSADSTRVGFPIRSSRALVRRAHRAGSSPSANAAVDLN